KAIGAAGKLDGAAWVLTPELSRKILARVKKEGSAAAGEAIYRRTQLQCVNCHAIGTAGGLVGPNLISVGGSSQPDYILESLLDPSAKLKEGYTTLTVLTEDAEVINGIVIGKTDELIRMRLADGKQREVALDQIAQQKPGKSLMPQGALDGLTEKELVDLVTFMSELGRTAKYTVSTEPMVRSFQTLIYSNEANRRLNRTSTDAAASDDPVMKWRLVTARVDGTLPLAELDQFKQHRQTPPTSFVRFVIELPETGAAGVVLPADGIEAWIDGKPTPVWNLKNQPLKKGKHTVVIAIDRTEVDEPFAVRLQGDAFEPSK
ncbi:MAG: L-sorbosone dehydrogenase, partial [Pirellulales bacterium]|nr:L-sorbosone dehydrogenase [Pirellulales bacterium]